MTKHILQLSLLICSIAFGQHSKTNNYDLWPNYQHLEFADIDTITAQSWKNENHVINGWDWSLPPAVTPSSRSLVGLQRIFNLTTDFSPFNLQFKSNAIGILWVKWRDLEPTQGTYNFQPLLDRINQAKSVGLDIILRVLTCSKSRGQDDKALSRGEAPLWLEDLGVTFLPQRDPVQYPNDNLNFDPSHPVFHENYLKLVQEIANNGIPQMVKAAYVGYASNAFGDEGIGPFEEPDSENNDAQLHVRERLDAWQNAFTGMEYKIFMGGVSQYGFDKGFGTRRGFVEMYMYRIPDEKLGQYIDNDGYLNVDETSLLISNNLFNGEVNEAYEEAWATADRGFRFGTTTASYPYRYFVSNLRALQMRCTYIHTTGHLVPKMLPFISQELGRTIEDTPDVWSFLRTSFLKATAYEKNDYKNRTITDNERIEGIETKNFERWLYQRDVAGYETIPAVQIDHPFDMWMIQEDKRFDYIARTGKKIGFNIDDRWKPHSNREQLAIKITYFDNETGSLILRFKNNDGFIIKEQSFLNDGALKTVTFLIDGLLNNSADDGFDFILQNSNSEKNITVSMARVVATNVEILSSNTYYKDDIHIHPNPVNDFITIKSGILFEKVKLYDSTGREVLNKKIRIKDNTYKIDVSSFNKGFYILVIKNENKYLTKKLIIN